MTGSPTRVGVVGNLCNVGHDLAVQLSLAGCEARLVVPSTGLDEWHRVHGEARQPEDDPHLDIVGGARWLRRVRAIARLRSYEVIVSVCLGGYPLIHRIGRPYVLYATGSDVREFAAGIDGSRACASATARAIVRRASIVWHSPDDAQVAVLDHIGVRHRRAWRHFVDIGYWAEVAEASGGDEIVVLSPASVNFRPLFPGQALKRTDVLIRGFARFLEGGGRGELRLLRRGQDVAAAEDLVAALRISASVRWVGAELTRDELRDQVEQCDVVADQFALGIFGLVGLEGMASGRPVLARVDEAAIERAYGADGGPPMPSLEDDEDVARELVRLSDPAVRAESGRALRRWVGDAHDPARLRQGFAADIAAVAAAGQRMAAETTSTMRSTSFGSK